MTAGDHCTSIQVMLNLAVSSNCTFRSGGDRFCSVARLSGALLNALARWSAVVMSVGSLALSMLPGHCSPSAKRIYDSVKLRDGLMVH